MFFSNWFKSIKSNDDIIEVLDFNKIYKNKVLMSKLRKLTLCINSGMNYELNHLSTLANIKKVNVKIITATRKDKMVGWALLSKEKSSFCFGKSDFDPIRDGALFEVFVDPNYRRTGIGSALIKKARRHAGSSHLCVAPHDIASDEFYIKHNKYKQKILSW